MWFVVLCTAATPVANPFDVVDWSDVDRCVVGAWGQRVHHISLVDDILHGSAVGLLGSAVVLLEVGVHDHDAEGFGQRFHLFHFGGRICGGGSRYRDHGVSCNGSESASSRGLEGGCSSSVVTGTVTGGSLGPGGGCGGSGNGSVVIGL